MKKKQLLLSFTKNEDDTVGLRYLPSMEVNEMISLAAGVLNLLEDEKVGEDIKVALLTGVETYMGRNPKKWKETQQRVSWYKESDAAEEQQNLSISVNLQNRMKS